jgi:dTDP-4-amino-4,6-dideoxy-D-galactose acyltransferase
MLIRRLTYDSELFGYPVGSIEIPESNQSPDHIKNLLEQPDAGYRLVYLFSKSGLSGLGEVMDIKLIFGKSVKSGEPALNPVKPWSGPLTGQLLQLAFDSGVHSRFRKDPSFRNGEFEQLYRQWIEKSLNGEIADAVLVHETKEGIQGMVTVALKQSDAVIGLIAVSSSARGRGIGRQLIDAAESFALSRGCGTLLVATQEANRAATGLYKSTGFSELDRTYVYHYWKKT